MAGYMDLDKWQRRRIRELKLNEERKKACVSPPRSHLKILLKWAKANDFQWHNGYWGRSSLWRNNKCFARLYFKDLGRHVIGKVELETGLRTNYKPKMCDDYFSRDHLANIGEAIRLLKDAKKVFENPALEPTLPVERLKREKFVPKRKGEQR